MWWAAPVGYTRGMADETSQHDQRPIALSKAASAVGVTSDYLRAAALSGALKATKDEATGKWMTTLADVIAFRSRRPNTPQGQAQKKRWAKAYAVMRDQVQAPTEQRAYHIPRDMLVNLGFRFAREWLRTPHESMHWRDADYIEMPLGQLRTVTAAQFVDRLGEIARDMQASEGQGLEVAVGGRDVRNMVMTSGRYDQYLAVLRKHAHEGDAHHTIKGARDAMELLGEAPRSCTFVDVQSPGRDGTHEGDAPIALVVMPHTLYDQLTRHVAWEIEVWFRSLLDQA